MYLALRWQQVTLTVEHKRLRCRNGIGVVLNFLHIIFPRSYAHSYAHSYAQSPSRIKLCILLFVSS